MLNTDSSDLSADFASFLHSSAAVPANAIVAKSAVSVSVELPAEASPVTAPEAAQDANMLPLPVAGKDFARPIARPATSDIALTPGKVTVGEPSTPDAATAEAATNAASATQAKEAGYRWQIDDDGATSACQGGHTRNPDRT